MSRRPRGEGGLRWDETRQRWIVTITVGYDGRGKRVVRKASGRSRTEASTKLRALVREQENGLAAGKQGYTVADAVEDFLAFGLSRQEAVTVGRYRSLSRRHLLPRLGARRLQALTAREVDSWLTALASELSTDSLRRLHGCLNRSVRRAMSRDLVGRNVVELAEIPSGRMGRPSKSLTPEQVDSVLTDTASDRLHGYIAVSLLTGARTEEMRALRLDHVHLDEALGVPPHIGCGGRCAREATLRRAGAGERWPSPLVPSRRCAASVCVRSRTGSRLVSGGTSRAWSSQRE